MSQRGDDYLRLPDSAPATGGLRWATGYDAIVDGNGKTVVLFEELEAILGGVFSATPVPTLLSVLLVVHALRREVVPPPFVALRDAYRRNQSAESLVRHFGRLIAELCEGLPPALDPPAWAEVQVALYRLWGDGQKLRANYAVLPDRTPAEFEECIGLQLAKRAPDVLDHYLKYGTAPTGAGEKLAEEIVDLPGTVARVLALAKARPRLVGAALLAPALDAAMTLPARSRSSESLPLGGYADVTTRGDPDRLLLSQFALDPDEFVRRFAERELLYFKREEPHSPVPPERVIVLDQGVRTWGGVRLALAAATLALLKQNPKKSPVPKLYPTSLGEAVPVSTAEVLAKVLEASDLTRNPAELLANVCGETDSDSPRDILLLTHPRSAIEPGVIAAADSRRATDRLFVLAVNDDGAAVLGEWTARGPVPVRSFRVDLVAAENAEAERDAAPAKPAGPSVDYKPWMGDVEPVPFPFRPGLLDQPEQMGFDAAGEWLVIVTRGGIPHALAVGEDKLEVLPRAMRDGAVLKQVTAVLPVNSGVVLCGKVIKSGSEFHSAAHYDRSKRSVQIYKLGPWKHLSVWLSFADLNCIVLRHERNQACMTADLSAATIATTPGSIQAASRFANSSLGAKSLCVIAQGGVTLENGDTSVVLKDNSFHLTERGHGVWNSLLPTQDGKPLLAGANVHSALLATDVLALAITKDKITELLLFRGPDPTALGVVPLDTHTKLFTLSPDGRKLAWVRGKLEVAIAETERVAHVIEKFPHAKLHGEFEVTCTAAPFELTIAVGSHRHEFGVHYGDFWYNRENRKNNKSGTKSSNSNERPPPGFDPLRFQVMTVADCKSYWVLRDRHGQVLLLDREANLLVVFLIRRDKAAAWTPAGGFWGDPELIGGAPTPNAEKEIALAIRPDWRTP